MSPGTPDLSPGTVPRPAPRILIVDDDPRSVDPLLRLLRRHGYRDLDRADSIADADGRLVGRWPDVILLDLSLSIMDSHTLLRRVRRDDSVDRPTVLLLAGRHPASAIKAALHEGAGGVIPQPFDGTEILRLVEAAVSDAGRGAVADAAESS